MDMIAHASTGASSHDPDQVIIKLQYEQDAKLYWRPEDLIYHFEYDLRDLFHRAGLRGVLEVKRIGRRERGIGQEGIALGHPQDFVIEINAEYGQQNKGRADVWFIKVDAKDTTPIRERLTRALAGEKLPSILEPPEKPESQPTIPEEPDVSTADVPWPTLPGQESSVKEALFRRDPLGMTYCLVFLWGSANADNQVERGVLTNIAMEYYPEFQDKRKTTPIHKSFGQEGFLSRLESGNYQLFLEPIKAFVSEHHDALIASPMFWKKIKKVEGLSQGNQGRMATQEALRAIERIYDLILEK